jgi:hypothetical protein
MVDLEQQTADLPDDRTRMSIDADEEDEPTAKVSFFSLAFCPGVFDPRARSVDALGSVAFGACLAFCSGFFGF